jgi:hypothetical protein
MPIIQTRRRFLTTLSVAGTASLIRTRWAEAADGPLETTTLRLQKPALCVSSLYIAEELLRAEASPISAIPPHRTAQHSSRSTATSIFPRPMPRTPSGRSMPVNR